MRQREKKGQRRVDELQEVEDGERFLNALDFDLFIASFGDQMGDPLCK